MKYLKRYDMFFEDGEGGGAVGGGVATANASNTAGPGNVVAAQPGAFAGTTGTTGTDIGFVLGYNPKKKRKKGGPSQVSDLRDLKEVDTVKADAVNLK